jgi:RES domain-containing protein
MMRLPWAAGPLKAWRLDMHAHAATWDSGIGAAKAGGRWNPAGYPVVYCAADPSTAILEVAVHTGFPVLDTIPHVMTSALVRDVEDVHVVMPEDVPNPLWLRPGSPGKGQQAFGRQLLEQHLFVLLPSAVSEESWNLLFNPSRAAGRYRLEAQKRFALDTRLNPP